MTGNEPTSAEISRFAWEMATRDMLRFVIAELLLELAGRDPDRFTQSLRRAEEDLIRQMADRLPFPKAPDAINERIRELAMMEVTKVFTSLRPPASS